MPWYRIIRVSGKSSVRSSHGLTAYLLRVKTNDKFKSLNNSLNGLIMRTWDTDGVSRLCINSEVTTVIGSDILCRTCCLDNGTRQWAAIMVIHMAINIWPIHWWIRYWCCREELENRLWQETNVHHIATNRRLNCLITNIGDFKYSTQPCIKGIVTIKICCRTYTGAIDDNRSTDNRLIVLV